MSNRNMALDVIVRLKDLLTGPLRRLRSTLDGIAGMARKIGLVGGAVAAISFMGPIQEAAAFQQKLLDISVTQGKVGQAAFVNVAEMKRQFQDLARQTAQSSEGIAEAAGQMIAAGLDRRLVDASIGNIARTATAANADIRDIAGLATSLMQNLKVPADQLDEALDSLVIGGKLGSFELRDMSKYFPTLTGQMAKFGVTGREAVNTLGAALQIARKGTSDPAEAANNLKNFLSKILAPATIKNFKDAGVDIEAVMQDAATKGINPIEAVVQKISKLTGVSGKQIEGLLQKAKDNGLQGADALASVREQLEKIYGAGKLGEIFGDMQVMDFLIPMLANLEEYKNIRKEINAADGSTTSNDFATQMKGLNQEIKLFNEQIGQISDEIGSAFGEWLPMLNENIGKALDEFRAFNEETAGMGRRLLILAGGGVIAAAGIGVLGVALPALGAGLSLVTTPLIGTGKAVFSLGRYFASAARGTIALQTALGAMSGANLSGIAKLATGLRGIAFAIPGISGLAGIMTGIGTAIATVSAPVWLLVAAFAALGVAVYKYWEPISNFMQGFGKVVGSAVSDALAALGRFTAEVAAWAGQKLIDLALWMGFDQATIDSVSASAQGLVDDIVGFFKGLPDAVGGFLSELFTQNDYSDAAEAGFRDAGARAGQAMVDAIKSAFSALFEWFGNLGKMIMDAIGKIDLSGLISLPSLPSLLGGGAPGPANDNAPGPANGNIQPNEIAAAQAPMPAQAPPQTLNVSTQATVKVEGPGRVVEQETNVSSPSPNVNTGRVIGRD